MEDWKHKHITLFCQRASSIDCHPQLLVMNVLIEMYYTFSISAYLKSLIALYINFPVISVS